MSSSVHVKNISGTTSEKEVRDFFSFCGKISTLTLTPDEKSQTALVTFEKESAAKTALLLDSTQLGTSQVQVTSAEPGTTTGATSSSPTDTKKDGEEFAQEEKPRARVVAEYLAHGYVLSDKAIEQAINMDKQHGYSTKFQNYLKSWDDQLKVTERAQTADAKFDITGKGQSAWQGLSSYFEKALGTPTGQKLRTFYEQGNKQVMDVHNEARHLANLKSGKHDPEKVEGSDNRTKCGCASEAGKCGCAPGQCACASCGKNPDAVTGQASESTSEKPTTATT